MKRISIFVVLALCAVASSLVMNEINGFSAKTSLRKELLPDGGSYADRHVERAIHLLRYGTLGDEKEPFFGGFARGPVEAGLIAAAFLLFGESMSSLWTLQMIFFVLAVWLLYLVSIRFLGERWALLPAAMLALFWGTSLYVFNVNNEIWCLFFIVGFAYSMLRYYESGAAWWLMSSGILLSLLVLAKPIFEYFIPISLLVVLIHTKHRNGWAKAVPHMALFASAIVLIVGGWHIRNYSVLGTPKISAGGHAFLIRTKTAEYPWRVIGGFFVSSMFGDYVGDAVVPGYAGLYEPRDTIRDIFNRRRPEMRQAGMTEFQTDEVFFEEAFQIIEKHPVKYLLTTPAWFFRLNNPPRHNGGMLERLFVDTYPNIPWWVKIITLLSLHSIWLAFVGTVFWRSYGWLMTRWNHTSLEIWLILLIVYTNAVYSFLAHAEVRYAVIVMPFYFLLFAVVLKDHFTKTKEPIAV